MAYHLQHPKTIFLKELLQRKFQAFSFLNYRIKWNLFPRLDIVSKFPLHVDIETTNRCNLRCTMCVQNSKEGRKNQGDIKFETVCRILEAIKGKVYSVKFNWRGEPLLYKRLPELIAYAKKCRIQETQINTNGTLLTKDLSYQLIRAGLDRIIFSVDGNSPETYEKIRVGGNYRLLMTNIHNFLHEKYRQNKTRPFVRVQMCVGEENKHEVESFVEYWKALGIPTGLIDQQERQESLKKDISDCSTLVVKCKQPWQRLTISWQGKVFPCCADWMENSPLLWKIPQESSTEQLREQFYKCWKDGKVITKVRQSLWSGNIQNTLCTRCPFTISNGKNSK